MWALWPFDKIAPEIRIDRLRSRLTVTRGPSLKVKGGLFSGESMAQGKLKVKSQLPANSKKSGKKNKVQSGGVKKAKKVVAPPKKAGELQLAKFKKEIRKNINSKIESELGKKAQQVEERGFHLGGIAVDPKSGKKSKK